MNRQTKLINCKFCNKECNNNRRGYCQDCYRYFITEGKQVYEIPPYGVIAYAPNGDVICPECGKAFAKLGQHIYMNHKKTTKVAYDEYGWNSPRYAHACSYEYKTKMKRIQDPKTITINLIEKGQRTRYKGGTYVLRNKRKANCQKREQY